MRTSKKPCYQKRKKSGQERILQENTQSVSDSIQTECMKQQQDENKTLAEMIKNYTDFRNLSDSLMNQEEILQSLNHKNKMHNEEKDEEKYQVYPEEEEEEKAMVEGKKD